MEVYWMMTAMLWIVLENLVMGYFLYRFARPFLECRKKTWWIGASYAVTMLFLYYIPIWMPNFVAYSIGIFVPFIVMCCMDRRNYRQKIFIAVTFFSLRWLSVYMAQDIQDMIEQKLNGVPFFVQDENRQLVLFILMSLVNIGLTTVIVGVTCHYLTKSYVYKSERMTRKEMLMLITPSITGITGYGIMQYYKTYYEDYTQNPESGIYHLLTISHYMISIVMIVVVIVLFQNIKARQDEKLQQELLKTQMEDTRQHVRQVERLYNDIRSLKHDMANHIMTLEHLWEQEEYFQAKEYAVQLKEALHDATAEIKSGNPVTDVLIAEYEEKAKQKKIMFQSTFFYPDTGKMDAFDMSILLNNAFDNALRAAEGYKASHGSAKITLSSYRNQNAYLICMENSFADKLERNGDTGLPATSKDNGQEHGYGLLNMKRVAEKYYGDIDMQQAEDRVKLVIMLMLQ